MDIYVKISFISIFLLFFWFSNTILPDALILPISKLQTQQVIKTSQIRSQTEYLIQTYYILLLILSSKFIKNLALMTVFNTI